MQKVFTDAFVYRWRLLSMKSQPLPVTFSQTENLLWLFKSLLHSLEFSICNFKPIYSVKHIFILLSPLFQFPKQPEEKHPALWWLKAFVFTQQRQTEYVWHLMQMRSYTGVSLEYFLHWNLYEIWLIMTLYFFMQQIPLSNQENMDSYNWYCFSGPMQELTISCLWDW